MFVIHLAFERVYFFPYCDHHAPGTSANAEQLWRGRHGRNSPAAPGARPAQTSFLLHPMRTDVPEDDPRILGTYKNCKESGRGFNPRPTGGGAISSPPLVFLRYLLNQCRYHHHTCSTLSPNNLTHCVKILKSRVL